MTWNRWTKGSIPKNRPVILHQLNAGELAHTLSTFQRGNDLYLVVETVNDPTHVYVGDMKELFLEGINLSVIIAQRKMDRRINQNGSTEH